MRAGGGALKPIGTAHPQDRLARVDRPLPASSSGGRLRILCHAEHSKAELGMNQRESGAGPHGGAQFGMGAGGPVRLRHCGRRAVGRGGSRRRAERLRKLRRF